MRKQAATYPGNGSIATLVAHSPNEIGRRLLLHRHFICERAQRGNIDGLTWTRNRAQLRHRLAVARNAERLAGSGALDELAEMRLRMRQRDRFHMVGSVLTN